MALNRTPMYIIGDCTLSEAPLALKLTEVDRVRAWEFCRRVRSAILAERSRTNRAR